MRPLANGVSDEWKRILKSNGSICFESGVSSIKCVKEFDGSWENDNYSHVTVPWDGTRSFLKSCLNKRRIIPARKVGKDSFSKGELDFFDELGDEIEARWQKYFITEKGWGEFVIRNDEYPIEIRADGVIEHWIQVYSQFIKRSPLAFSR